MRRRALALLACSLAAASTATAGVVAVPINHTVRLAVAGSAASVVVGNPAVADVTVVDSRTVFVSGRGYGSTDVTVLDSLGRTLYSSEIEVAAPSRGRVAVYRGGARSDLTCDPGCGPNGTAAAGAAAPTMGGSSGSAAATSAAALPSAIPNAIPNAIANSAGSAPRPPFAAGGSGNGGPK